jgi:hypothetical protein
MRAHQTLTIVLRVLALAPGIGSAAPSRTLVATHVAKLASPRAELIRRASDPRNPKRFEALVALRPSER